MYLSDEVDIALNNYQSQQYTNSYYERIIIWRAKRAVTNLPYVCTRMGPYFLIYAGLQRFVTRSVSEIAIYVPGRKKNQPPS